MAGYIIRGFDGPWDVLEDAAASAVLLCILRLDRIGPTRTDPFKHFWSIISNAILAHIQGERHREQMTRLMRLAGPTPRRIDPREGRAFYEQLRLRKSRAA